MAAPHGQLTTHIAEPARIHRASRASRKEPPVGNAIVELVPLILGAAIVPVWIIIVLFLLRGQSGLLKAAAFVAGISAVRLAQGIAFGYVFGASQDASGQGGSSSIVSTLLVVVGILMFIAAFKTYRKEEDPDGPPPKWMQMFGKATPAKAFALGALLVAVAAKQWVFTLSAIGMIVQASLSQVENVVSFLVFVLLAISLLLVPILFSVIAPQRAGVTLEKMGKWLEKHNRQIVIAVSIIFGAFFLWKGVAGLIG